MRRPRRSKSTSAAWGTSSEGNLPGRRAVRVLVLVWLTSLVAVPGIAAALLLYGPGEIGFPTRLAIVIPLGYGVVGGIAYVLALLHGMHPVPFFEVLGVATAALWVALLRRTSLREHARAIGGQFRADRLALWIGVLVILGIAAVRALYVRNLPIISPFRYWVDAMEIGSAGRIPAQSLQYGTLYPPATSKIFLNVFNAGVGFAAARDSIASLAGLAWIGAVGLAISMWAFARELGLGLTAPLVPVLALMNRMFLSPELTIDLSSYRAETFGRIVGIAALAVGIRALRDHRGWKDAVVAGGLVAVTAGTHLVPFIVVGIVFASYVVARLVVDRRSVRAIARTAVTIGTVAGVVGAAILFLPRGDIGFQGAQSPGEYGHFDRGFDETLYLYTGRIVPGIHKHGRWYIQPADMYGMYASRALAIPPKSSLRPLLKPLKWIIGIGGLFLAIVMLLWFPEPLRAIGLTAWGLGAGLLVAALTFSYRYDVYVPALFGVRRLYDHAALPLILLGLAVIEAALVLAARRTRHAMTAGAVFVIIVSAAVIPWRTLPQQSAATRSQVLQLVNWVRQHTSCDDRLLTNERTVGIFRALTGRVNVMEGMGPFLRPDILDDVVDLALSARAFYEDPAAHSGFLAKEGVDYVIALKTLRVGFRGPIGDATPGVLGGKAFLQPVYSSTGFDVYKVVGLSMTGRFPNPADYPGYPCTTTSLSA
jgi:hypothetical protein